MGMAMSYSPHRIEIQTHISLKAPPLSNRETFRGGITRSSFSISSILVRILAQILSDRVFSPEIIQSIFPVAGGHTQSFPHYCFELSRRKPGEPVPS
jgi:hypothetical protein